MRVGVQSAMVPRRHEHELFGTSHLRQIGGRGRRRLVSEGDGGSINCQDVDGYGTDLTCTKKLWDASKCVCAVVLGDPTQRFMRAGPHAPRAVRQGSWRWTLGLMSRASKCHGLSASSSSKGADKYRNEGVEPDPISP